MNRLLTYLYIEIDHEGRIQGSIIQVSIQTGEYNTGQDTGEYTNTGQDTEEYKYTGQYTGEYNTGQYTGEYNTGQDTGEYKYRSGYRGVHYRPGYRGVQYRPGYRGVQIQVKKQRNSADIGPYTVVIRGIYNYEYLVSLDTQPCPKIIQFMFKNLTCRSWSSKFVNSHLHTVQYIVYCMYLAHNLLRLLQPCYRL